MTVIAFPNVNDIPGMLRVLADNIAAGKYGNAVVSAAMVLDTGDEVARFGWGVAEDDQQIVLHFKALVSLAKDVFND